MTEAFLRNRFSVAFAVLGMLGMATAGFSQDRYPSELLISPQLSGRGMLESEFPGLGPFPGLGQPPSDQTHLDQTHLDERHPGEDPYVIQEVPIERFRRGFFQGFEVLGGYLGDVGGGADELNQTYQEVRVGFGVPLGSLDNILAVRPYFRAEQLQGPEVLDVPGTLYDTGVTLFNRKQWTERLSTTVIATPSVRSDFTTSENAFRIFGVGLLNWQKRPDLTLSFGAVYLDRADLPLLPAFGLTWLPDPTLRIDLILPRPRIAKRVWKDGGEAEAWAYLVGQLGGNTYSVSRVDGRRDELSLRDFRIAAGYEVLRRDNRGYVVEGGIALGRQLRYELPEVTVSLDDAIYVQAGWQF